MSAARPPRLSANALRKAQHVLTPLNRQLPATRRHLSSARLFNYTRPSQVKVSPNTPSTRAYEYFLRSVKIPFQRLRQIRFQSSKPAEAPKPNVTSNLGSPTSSLSFSQRMRKLSREYGWSAFGIYMGLSALDFPFCFLAVRGLGTERIGHWEHEIVQGFWKVVSYPFPQLAKYGPNGGKSSSGDQHELKPGQDVLVDQPAEWSWGVEEAQENYKADATIWTQLALAYAIHKSFIFIRVPITVAITPKVVKTLRGWGWNIGKRTPKTANKPSSS